jgi:hypothetical protein
MRGQHRATYPTTFPANPLNPNARAKIYPTPPNQRDNARALQNFSAPTPIAELWRTARAWFAEALDIFGGAYTIRLTFSASARRTIARQLKALETLAMKLLVIEAATLSLPARAQSPRAARSAQRRAIRATDPARPETWRVTFRLQIPPEPTDKTAPRFRSLGPSRFIRAVVLDPKALAKKLALLSNLRAKRDDETRARTKAEKLARRCEALRRVFANPIPSARRLKRKLLALKQRSFAAATRIAILRPPPRQLEPALHERAEYAAQYATPAFAAFDSS